MITVRNGVLVALTALVVGGHAEADDEDILVASTGFNTPFYEPYVTVVGHGVGETGWAGPWTGLGNETGLNAIAQPDVVFEGDLALKITPTDRVGRILSQSQTGVFAVDQYVRLSSSGRMVAYTQNSEDFSGTGAAGVGAQWAALEDSRIVVLDGDGNQGGEVEDTGFRYVPDTWHHVTVIVDVTTSTWSSYFDGQPYNSPDPLNFRGSPTSIDAVQFLGEVSGLSYVDDVRVLRPKHKKFKTIPAAVSQLRLTRTQRREVAVILNRPRQEELRDWMANLPQSEPAATLSLPGPKAEHSRFRVQAIHEHEQVLNSNQIARLNG